MEAAPRRRESPPFLNVFCMKEGDAWRVHLAPEGIPPELERLFDQHGEAYPVLLDWEDLERHMRENGAQYRTHLSRAGSVELTAEGAQAATALARWVASALASGIRTTGDDRGTSEPDAG
jgi:hypothetical protein